MHGHPLPLPGHDAFLHLAARPPFLELHLTAVVQPAANCSDESVLQALSHGCSSTAEFTAAKRRRSFTNIVGLVFVLLDVAQKIFVSDAPVPGRSDRHVLDEAFSTMSID